MRALLAAALLSGCATVHRGIGPEEAPCRVMHGAGITAITVRVDVQNEGYVRDPGWRLFATFEDGLIRGRDLGHSVLGRLVGDRVVAVDTALAPWTFAPLGPKGTHATRGDREARFTVEGECKRPQLAVGALTALKLAEELAAQQKLRSFRSLDGRL